MERSRLTRRITALLALVLVADALFVGVVAALLTPWLAPARNALAATLPLGDRSTTIAWWLVVLGPALVAFVWAQLQYTKRHALAAVDARPADPDDYPHLHEQVTRLAQQAGVPAPDVAIADVEVPNSFVVGTPGAATLVVTEGLLSTLDGEQRAAVLAHELAHLQNRDATVMTLATFLPALTGDEYSLLDDVLPDRRPLRLGLAVALVAAAYVLSAAVIDAPLGSLGFTAGFVFFLALTVLFGGVALGVVTAPVVYLSRSLSRAREFVADRGSARLTGQPAALATALRELDDSETTPDTDKRAAYEGVRGLCLLPHGIGVDGEATDGVRVDTRSHPSTDERIERLRDLQKEL